MSNVLEARMITALEKMLKRPEYVQAVQEAKQLDCYPKLIKKYRKVEGYLPYSEVAIALSILIRAGKYTSNGKWGEDIALAAGMISSKLIEEFGTPVYWLQRDLCQAFLQTDLPKEIDLKKTFPWAIIMLPQGIINTPEGYPVEWLFVQILEKGYEFPSLKFGNKTIHTQIIEEDRIRWFAQIRGGATYSSTFSFESKGIKEKGEFFCELNSLKFFGANTDINPERELTNKLDSLTIQLLMYMQYSRLGEIDLPTPTKGIGFGAKSKQKLQSIESMLNPVWIGKDYKIKREPHPSSGHHNSPQAHWRRGHYHRVPVGKRELNLRKTVWFEPTFVGG